MRYIENISVNKIKTGKAKCSVDLGVGSERGEYVNMDYVLHKMDRPHRAISLMFCYYPLDKEFPARMSKVYFEKMPCGPWSFPYDDYFTYKGGLIGNGKTDDEPFTYMRDIRRHGQDVNLTLTIDPHVSDEHLIAIAKDLKTFGRMYLRINHEATGNWFNFNKRSTYQEVADFFTHFANIIHEYAPNVKTVLCIGGVENPSNGPEMEKEEEFKGCVPVTDIWSVDKYMALHYGFPCDVCDTDTDTNVRRSVKEIFEHTKLSYERFLHLNNGVAKPMTMAECNADGDVTGPYEQAEMFKEFCDMIVENKAEWFTGFTMYQFRDKGRLGLEFEDPNYPDLGIEQPIYKTYKDIINNNDWFKPSIESLENVTLPTTLRWGASDDSEGLEVPLVLEENPHFFELYFDEDDDSNYVIEINGKWFYKSPKVKYLDLMAAFFDKKIEKNTEMTLKFFAPPASGENDNNGNDDWDTNYYYEVKKLPKIRIIYAPIKK